MVILDQTERAKGIEVPSLKWIMVLVVVMLVISIAINAKP